MLKGRPIRFFGNFLAICFKYLLSFVPTLLIVTRPRLSLSTYDVTCSNVARSASVAACTVISAVISTSLRDAASTRIVPFGAPMMATVPPAPKSSLSVFVITRFSWADVQSAHANSIENRAIILFVFMIIYTEEKGGSRCQTDSTVYNRSGQ